MRFDVLMVALAALPIAAAPPQVPKDAQSTYEPRTGPGAGQKFLERFVGDWDVTKTFYPRSGDPIRAEGQCRQAMIHEGRFLQSEFVFRQGETKSTGLGIIGFEPGPGTFTSIWTDSRSTQMSMRQSRDRFDGEQIVLYSRSLDADGKDARRSRTVTRLEEDGRKIVHRQFALSPDGEERLMMELMMTRKLGTSSPGK
jgi:hypothetical protein